MPLYRPSTSAAPGRPVATLPTVGVPFGIPLSLLPPAKTRPSTIPRTTSTTTAAAAASTRGLAWRRRGEPFDWTGGGDAAAIRRACLLFLPLGIGRKGSGVLGGLPGGER